MKLTGIHHLSAITADAHANHDFYTRLLGMRLAKKTVNQDDTSAYHLFYADGLASPGTDLTFFHYPSRRERFGTRSIVRTGLRVANEKTLRYWLERFNEAGVSHGSIIERDGRGTLDFTDPEGQRLSLVVDVPTAEVHPWERSTVPAEHQVRGLGPITISVPDIDLTGPVLTDVMNMRKVREYSAGHSNGSDGTATVHVYEMGEGNAPAAELHVAHEPQLQRAHPGSGGVHHVAFRIPTFEEYDRWYQRLNEHGIHSSGPVDRFYFRSLYFREPNGILFELATDGPGFAADEPMDKLGEKLALPPFLEGRRASIEAGLKPL